MSPQLGQGVNLALLDALALGDAVAAALTQGAVSDGKAQPVWRNAVWDAELQAFERSRQRHVRWYRWASHGLTPLFQSEADGLARLRDLAFAPSAKVPGIRGLSHHLLTGRLGLARR